jgi:L-rhamnose-H+ transport protein
MIPIAPNPTLGVSFHAVGAAFAANCYAPQKYIQHWSWEIFWMVQAAWCWLLWPIIGAVCTIPHLWQVLAESPGWPMFICLLMGIAYGIGGTAFNISIRYIGFSLTYAIAVGLSSILGTLAPPLFEGQFAENLKKPGAGWVMAGVLAGVIGIALCGLAGYSKERDLRAQDAGPGEFSWLKGLLLSLLAGVLSAVYGLAIGFEAKPIIEVAERLGAGYWKGNVAYLFVNPGAFLTALVFSLYLARKNRSLGELVRLPGGTFGGLVANYGLAILTGTLWYGQFFFYNLGHVRMEHEYTSWAIHMIMLVLISNLTGVLFKEWKGCRAGTRTAIGVALLVLLAAVVMIANGNRLAEQKTLQPSPETETGASFF